MTGQKEDVETFTRSWFASKDPKVREQENFVNAMHKHWRDWLARALSGVLKRTVPPEEGSDTLRRLDARHLAALDPALRYGAWHMNLGRPAKGMVRLSMVEPHDPDSEAFLFTAACDANGFIREQAIVAFAHCPGRLAIAIALLRADDWVAEVREASSRLLQQTILATGGGELYDFLELILALKERTRFATQVWPQLIEPALLNPSNASKRWEATRKGRASVRLFAYSLVTRADPDRRAEACLEAAKGTDPGVARWAFRAGAESLGAAAFGELTKSALHHPHGSVRAEALRQLATIDSEDAFDAIEQALFDTSRSVRNAAAYLIRANFQIDPVDRWRHALNGDSAQRACIALESLADFALPEDADSLVPWLTHRKATIRAAALRALSRTGVPELPEILKAALRDKTTTVVREALAVYKRNPGWFGKELLRSTYAAASNERVQSSLRHSLPLLDKWDVLEVCLGWYLECDPTKKYVLEAELWRWRRMASRRFTPLKYPSRVRISELLSAVQTKISSTNWNDIQHALVHA